MSICHAGNMIFNIALIIVILSTLLKDHWNIAVAKLRVTAG